jgi:epsin
LQPQQTSAFLQPQFTAVPTQYTSFNPYQQQAQQEALQAEYQRQQNEWLLQQQQQQQQQLLAQQQQQQQQEEWFRQQQLLQFQQQQQQQQPLVPAVTGFGSNNPFAPAPTPISPVSSPQLNAPQPSVQFNLGGTYSNGTTPSFSSASPQPPQQSLSAPASAPSSSSRGPSRADQDHANLASLFAARTDDGVDSFGNVGALRYGQAQGKPLAAQPTGANNPFYQPQQQQQQQNAYGQQSAFGQQNPYGQQNNDQPFFSV